MRASFLLPTLLLSTLIAHAQSTRIPEPKALETWCTTAKPGDTAILVGGPWKDVVLRIRVNGSQARPIVIMPEKNKQLILSGNSRIEIGSSYLEVRGLYFKSGYAGDQPVVKFKSGQQVASYCTLTETVIDDYNNPLRMQENYWVALHGHHNTVTRCHFQGKKNMGVLLAVILEEPESRENHHQITYNRFGPRIPLSSNTGEMIRVGVSQHCQFASQTTIAYNYFDRCDGETEIVSIKSGRNRVLHNVFEACQGAVVLRHGDNNTVAFNQFIGKGKLGSGGVRVINHGQWVIQNYFEDCVGENFRSPLAVMNGIPNSPAHRYVQVTDALILQNTFLRCAPITFGEGSDAERTLAPERVWMIQNAILNESAFPAYLAHDRLDGIQGSDNRYQYQPDRFALSGWQKIGNSNIPSKSTNTAPAQSAPVALSDSLSVRWQQWQIESTDRIDQSLSKTFQLPSSDVLAAARNTIQKKSGTSWFVPTEPTVPTFKKVTAPDTKTLIALLKNKEPQHITLTGKTYRLTEPLIIQSKLIIEGKSKNIDWNTDQIATCLYIQGGASLELRNLHLKGNQIQARYFIQTDTTGPSEKTRFDMVKSSFQGHGPSMKAWFYASKTSLADQIYIRNSGFESLSCIWMDMSAEKDNKGWYPAEEINIEQNRFVGLTEPLLILYRGGNDESTLGPRLQFQQNHISITRMEHPLLQLTGVQISVIKNNTVSGTTKKWIDYIDITKAKHIE
jgi:poly(beta-D-mannuronate) lyase